jgi:HAD superfamily phosphoserine phosphatase-like hydrolase
MIESGICSLEINGKIGTINKLIVYDFCGTIVDIQTADRFVLFCLRKKLLKKCCFYLLKITQHLLNRVHLFHLNKASFLRLLRGISKKQLEKDAKLFAEILVRKHLRYEIHDFINNNTSSTCVSYIVSAGYSLYIKNVSEYLGIDGFCASDIQFDDLGRCRGSYLNDYYFEGKIKAIEKILGLYPFINRIVALGDSITDIPILEMANEAIVVHPSKKLKNIAREKGWYIYD